MTKLPFNKLRPFRRQRPVLGSTLDGFKPSSFKNH